MIYRFGDHALDTEGFRLSAGGDEIPVEPQVFALLQLLIENRDRVVRKDEIIERVWDGRIVSDGTLNSRINSARRALGDDGKVQAVIRTFPRRGFRFVAALSEDDDIAPAPAPVSDKPSIAVLPFHNLSDDPEQEYFSDGITEDIITSLSRIRLFFVVARNTTFTYKGQAVDVQAVANELGVRYILEGSVRKAADTVRISVQLIDGETGNQIWAEKYDRDLADIFALQDEITQTVVGAIEPEMDRAERDRATLYKPESAGAWEYYHKGAAQLWDQGEHGQPRHVKKALDSFNKCIELDPSFARAYSAVAHCSFIRVVLGQTEHRAEVLNEGFSAARKAIELDQYDAFAYAQLGALHFVNREPEEAIRICKTAIELNPASSPAYHWLGMSETSCGKALEGVKHCEISVQLAPRDPLVGPVMAWIAIGNLCLGNYEKTVEWAQKALDLPTTQFWANAALVSAFGHLDNQTAAIRAREALTRRKPNFTIEFTEKTFPVTYPDYIATFTDGLRKAGVPES